MAEILREIELARNLLYEDPLLNSIVIYETFFRRDYQVFIDRLPSPRGVMAVSESKPHIIGLASNDEEATISLLESLARGEEYRFHALNKEWVPLVMEKLDVKKQMPCWFFTMEEDDFAGEVRHEVSPLRPEDAKTIAKHWNPREDMTNYIRSRIERGPALGVWMDGELVAWNATHWETDMVVVLGFLYVKEGYRGIGLAKSLSAAMCKEVIQRGKTPCCHVFVDNQASINLTLELGFRIAGEQHWIRGRVK